MAACYIAEIRLFGGTFAPRYWAYCNGVLLAINQNTALYSLIGTTFGGDGRTTMALPDMRSRVPLHQGQGNGTSFRPMGQMTGVEQIHLSLAQIPPHSHTLHASQDVANSPNLSGRTLAKEKYYAEPDNSIATETFAPDVIEDTGVSNPHTNIMPVLGMNFIIALEGLFPSRN